MKYTLNLTANIWEKLDVALREGEKIRIQGASPDSKFRIEFNDGIASPGVGDKPGLILDGLQEVSMSNPYLWVMSDRTMDVDVEVCPTAASGSISLPGGAATEAKQDAQITELQAITTAIQNKKQVGYARVEDANGDEFNQVSTIDASVAPPVMTVYYFDDSGVAQTPVEPINVINTDQVSSDMLSFKAIVATVNYEIGDTLTKRTILTNGAKTGSFWTNETTNLAISAPPSTDYEQADDNVFVKAIGSIDDASQTDETQDATLISLSKGTIATIKSNTIKTSAKGSTVAGSPTSENVSDDRQGMHVTEALPNPTSNALVFTGSNSNSFTLKPNAWARFHFNFTGVDTVKLQIEESSGVWSDFYLFTDVPFDHASSVVGRQTRVFETRVLNANFRFVRTNTNVSVVVIQ